MRFIADAMLGRLAKWLRMLGVDTAYIPDVEDSRLVKIARSEGRTILTRDRRLSVDFPYAECIALNANDTAGQLRELAVAMGGLPENKSRCSVCNGEIEPVDKIDVMNRVPEYVYLSKHDFFECAGCKKVYWEGSHRRNFILEVREILKGIDSVRDGKTA